MALAASAGSPDLFSSLDLDAGAPPGLLLRSEAEADFPFVAAAAVPGAGSGLPFSAADLCNAANSEALPASNTRTTARAIHFRRPMACEWRPDCGARPSTACTQE